MRHRASPLAAAAMGRLLTASILLSSDFKDSFRLTVEVNGGGPLGRVTAEVRTGGKVRVRTEHSEVDLPLRPDGKLAVGQAVGRTGYFRVLREDAFSHRYEGQVELATGEIGDDLMRYYLQSEQIPSAVALGVLVGPDGVVQGAGGVVVQALPGCPDELRDGVAERFSILSKISHRISEGDTPESLLSDVLGGPIRAYEAEPFEFLCECSKARSLDIIASLPRADIKSLLADGGAEVVCHFCETAYHITEPELRNLVARGI